MSVGEIKGPKDLTLPTECPACGSAMVVMKSGENADKPSLLAEYVCGVIIGRDYISDEKSSVSIDAGCCVVVARALGEPA